jgi:hypothetical protein
MKNFARSLGKIVFWSGFFMLPLAGVSGCATFLEGVRLAGGLLLATSAMLGDIKEEEEAQETAKKLGITDTEMDRSRREEERRERYRLEDALMEMLNSGIDSLEERVEKEPVEKEKEKEKTPNSLPRIWPDVSTGL